MMTPRGNRCNLLNKYSFRLYLLNQSNMHLALNISHPRSLSQNRIFDTLTLSLPNMTKGKFDKNPKFHLIL